MDNTNSDGGKIVLVAVFQETDGARGAVRELRAAGYSADLGGPGGAREDNATGDTMVTVQDNGKAAEIRKLLMDNGATSVVAETFFGDSKS